MPQNNAAEAAPRAGVGHNVRPFGADVLSRVDELATNTDRWVTERKAIKSQGHAERAQGFLTQLRETGNAVESQRVREKAPA